MKNNNGKSILPATPYILWSSLFIVIPLLIVIFFSFTISTSDGYKFSLENFQRLLDPNYFTVFKRSIWLAFQATIGCLILGYPVAYLTDGYKFSLENFQRLLDPNYFTVFKRSIWLAFQATIGCLILGYPVAYLISKMRPGKRDMLIMLFIVPMWMNFLLRTYAWLPILGKNGFINNFLELIGIGRVNLLYNDFAVLLGMVYNFLPFMVLPIYTVLTKMDTDLINAASDLGASRGILYNDFAVLLGMVYNFLPFMVLPIYTVLTKMDTDLINAASDLGASRGKVFSKIILPLSMPGVVSGITMVFMPAVSTFVISRLLGGGQYMLLGNLIEQQYTTMGDWNFGSAIAIFMMIVILISMGIMNLFEGSDDKEGGGSMLW